LKEIINIIQEERSTDNLEVRPIGTTGTTPRTPSKQEDGRWSVVRPKCQKRNQDPQQFKITLVVNRFVMPLETFPDATEEEGKMIIACGAVKEKPRKHKVLLLVDSQVRGCADLLSRVLRPVIF
jgi:hypothetical protein